MKTLGDVFEVQHSTRQYMEIFGSTKEAEEDYYRRLRAVGNALRDDLGITPQQAQELPQDTPLTVRAEEQFNELVIWVKRNSGMEFTK